MTAPDATPARGDEYTQAEINAMTAALDRVLHRHVNEPDALVTEVDGLTCAHVSMLATGIERALDAVSRPACVGCGERFVEGDEIRAHVGTCEKHPLARLVRGLPQPHEKYVVVSNEMVAELQTAPSRPVTVSIVQADGGRLEMTFTAYEHGSPAGGANA